MTIRVQRASHSSMLQTNTCISGWELTVEIYNVIFFKLSVTSNKVICLPWRLLWIMFHPLLIQSIWTENGQNIARNNCLQGKQITLVESYWCYEKYKRIHDSWWFNLLKSKPTPSPTLERLTNHINPLKTHLKDLVCEAENCLIFIALLPSFKQTRSC